MKMSFLRGEILKKNIYNKNSLKCATDMEKKNLKMLTLCQHASLFLQRTK